MNQSVNLPLEGEESPLPCPWASTMSATGGPPLREHAWDSHGWDSATPQITRKSLLKQLHGRKQHVGYEGPLTYSESRRYLRPCSSTVTPSLRCLTFEPCCLQCEIRCTSLMQLLCGFGGVITGKVLRTLAQVDTWIPCIPCIELAYLYSSVGNHPKP